ncbi:hypothetical protein Aph02nite_24180 [Actinoplanes philippinensis]|uniref:hypothetical protein n=1 Tax=Actinoplanes philippinensis TaxID=35752 RepID=UPI001160B407|nr:hypothetical protein [Actinoplanes philippinensis]GIE76468.1 hypothetical protein Aph02nite_24180 [Actinoplanes philippinensis]
MDERQPVVAHIRQMASDGRTASDVLTWLTSDAGQGKGMFWNLSCMFLAFENSLFSLRQIERWRGFGDGGVLTDPEVDEMVGPLVIRTKPIRDEASGTWY